MHLTRRRTLFTALLAVFGPLVFLVCEAISAQAWTAGVYDYGHNFISDLGTTVCGSTFGGREMCSPLHAVMNFGFVAMGLALATAAVLIGTRLAGRRRFALFILGPSIAVGMFLVAGFPGGVESEQNGTIALHALGAAIAIAAGNIVAIVVGSASIRLGFARWHRVLVTTLGIVGLIALVLTLADPGFLDAAIFERTAVYAIFAFWLATAAAIWGWYTRTRDVASA